MKANSEKTEPKPVSIATLTRRQRRELLARRNKIEPYGWPRCQDQKVTKVRWNEKQQQHQLTWVAKQNAVRLACNS